MLRPSIMLLQNIKQNIILLQEKSLKILNWAYIVEGQKYNSLINHIREISNAKQLKISK